MKRARKTSPNSPPLPTGEEPLLQCYGTPLLSPVGKGLATSWRWYLEHHTARVQADDATDTQWYRVGAKHYLVTRGYLLRLTDLPEEDIARLYDTLAQPLSRAAWFSSLADAYRRTVERAAQWGKDVPLLAKKMPD